MTNRKLITDLLAFCDLDAEAMVRVVWRDQDNMTKGESIVPVMWSDVNARIWVLNEDIQENRQAAT